MEEEINERFKKIMQREKLTAGAFAESIGVAQATISHILASRNKPSAEVLTKLHERYKNVNLSWLLTGAGNMTDDSIVPNSTSDYPSLFDENSKNNHGESGKMEYCRESALDPPLRTAKEIVKQEIIYKERTPRKITEIRIFFDDNTYETFKPEN